ncbi:serine/threonine-protein kinase RIO1-like [Amphibalanus amphitrite]|uniref:serine/threonine-protein kinase RIO1-like n=1 Tax=Amphibalanus amphitrite TaxID=1232801 RepID=UPI001C90DE29|nr:serine/threonine-protein kinase RIO1-like [Amphibalanus amphitrite]
MDIMEGQFSDADDDQTALESSNISNKQGAFQPAVSAVTGGLAELSTHASELSEEVSRATKEDTVFTDDQDLDEDYQSDEDAEFYDWDPSCKKDLTKEYLSHRGASQAGGTAGGGGKNFQPSKNLMMRYSNRINLDRYDGPRVSHAVRNQISEAAKRDDSARIRTKDKKDRATVEQVLDPRTRMILYQLMDREYFTEINGSVSMGKEANVFHASGAPPLNEDGTGTERAVKIYKTSILTFKDREKYVAGEFRHRHGYSKHNPRKMVQTWAEKEMRNLTRLTRAGVPCPQPVLLRSNVLVMGFIGEQGRAAPKLHDASISSSKARELYLDVVKMMRTIYHECRLVHADLSEYNMLYFKGRVYIIDVSQSLEHDHQNSLFFLRKDCTNITNYFTRLQVATMTVRELFDFIVDPNIGADNQADYLSRMMAVTAERGQLTNQQIVDEEVFKNAYIPKRLDEVFNAERDIKQAKSGERELIYSTITGIKPDLSAVQLVPTRLGQTAGHSEGEEGEEGDASGSSGEEDSEDSEDEDGGSKFVNSRRPRDESPDSKKERKKAVKEQKAEKRKSKVKKHIKKRKEKENKKK